MTLCDPERPPHNSADNQGKAKSRNHRESVIQKKLQDEAHKEAHHEALFLGTIWFPAP